MTPSSRARAFSACVWAFGLGARGGPPISVDPPTVMRGAATHVEVTVTVEAGEAPTVVASEGQLLPLGADVHHRRYEWMPPASRAPAWVLFVVWSEPPEGVPKPSLARLRVLGRTELNVDTEPSASVTVKVGDDSFGPTRADAHGHARVSIVVSPDATSATVLAVAHGRSSRREASLSLPPSPWLAGFSPLDPKGGGYLMVASPTPLSPQDVDVQLEGATLRPLPDAGPVLLFRVQPEMDATRVVAQVSAHGEALVRARADAPLGRPPAGLPGPEGLEATLLAGFFAAGSANHGPWGRGAAGIPIRFDALDLVPELSVGIAEASFSRSTPLYGRLVAEVLGVPIELGARATLWTHGALRLGAGLALGIVPFATSFTSGTFEGFRQTGVGPSAAAYAQGGYRLARWELVLEVRGAWAPAVSSATRAQLGGFILGAGGRFGP